MTSDGMSREQILELWESRFSKLLKLEGEAYAEYRLLLNRYSHLLAGSRLRIVIRRIMRAEAEHVSIALRLLEIARKERGKETARRPGEPSGAKK